MPKQIYRDPVYKQVSEALVELIAREYAAGDRFLSERQVSEQYGISRTTANKALSNLVIDGLLEFRKGKGSFVRRRAPSLNLRRLVSFTEKATEAGLRPETSVRTFATRPADDLRRLGVSSVVPILGITRQHDVYEMERIRSINGETVIYECRALREDLCPDLTMDDVAGSLYTVFHDRYGLSLDRVTQRIRAKNASQEEGDALAIEPGTALLHLTAVGYANDGVPLWYEETRYRGDAYEFVNQLSSSGDDEPTSLGPMSEREEPAPW